MIEIQTARSLVLKRAQPGVPTRTRIVQGLGRILSEDILATAEAPPHDKAMVDGYAAQSTDLVEAGVRLTVIEEIMAGQVPARTVGVGQTTRIMTGAVVPEGADCVIPVERTELHQHDSIESVLFAVVARSGQNLQRRGAVVRSGQTILTAGKVLRPIEIGLLAEFGIDSVMAFPAPKVAVLPTGDELVDFERTPVPGQIRNSNGPLLDALLRSLGTEPVQLGIGPDRYDELARLVRKGLNCDILILSGGVSMGQKDLVPKVLEDLKVETVFHRVRMRPGKPVWFGVFQGETHRALVFGLPGNPVSSFVCFQLLVRPAIRRMMGYSQPESLRRATLNREHVMLDERPTLYPARRIGIDKVETLPWKGSSDQVTMADSDCLIFFPEPRTYREGDDVDIIEHEE